MVVASWHMAERGRLKPSVEMIPWSFIDKIDSHSTFGLRPVPYRLAAQHPPLGGLEGWFLEFFIKTGGGPQLP
jgi:hypothetical protein